MYTQSFCSKILCTKIRFSHFCWTVHAALGVLSVILTDKTQKMKIANEFVSDFTAVGIWAHIPRYVGFGTNVRQVLANFEYKIGSEII